MDFVGWVLGGVAGLLLGLNGVGGVGYWFWDKVNFVNRAWVVFADGILSCVYRFLDKVCFVDRVWMVFVVYILIYKDERLF